MQVAIFEATDTEQAHKLNVFLAEDGRSIAVDRILTAGGGTDGTSYHYITVIYTKLEQAPL